ncbi:MAG: hypothetical protein KGI51_12390, partial [Rhodospirillales bacterium]|nr:hypothetical protein [Rhodospirillales bacterium]
NPALIARIGAARLARLRARVAAEADWVAGRAALVHGRRAEALGRLRRSFAARPEPHRALLLGWWHVAGLIPAAPPRPARAPRHP